MKFTKLKQTILKKRFDKSLSENIKNRIVSQKEIQSVGIITTEKITSKINVQKQIETILGVRNSKIYSFRNFNKLDEPSYKHFSENDINWKGQFVEPSFQSFLEQPFDLLIGFYKNSNLYLENATLQSKSTFKVGFSNVNPSLYEIEISGDTDNINAFCKELKKYLVVLKKLKN